MRYAWRPGKNYVECCFFAYFTSATEYNTAPLCKSFAIAGVESHVLIDANVATYIMCTDVTVRFKAVPCYTDA